jgi:hypothetical protein
LSTVRPDCANPIDFKLGRVDLSRGGGGSAPAQLVEHLRQRACDSERLAQRNDQTLLPCRPGDRDRQRLLRRQPARALPRCAAVAGSGSGAGNPSAQRVGRYAL